MKIATWNINSIRARENRVEDWLDEHDVDVLALEWRGNCLPRRP